MHSPNRRKHSEMHNLLLTKTSHCSALDDNNQLGPANAQKHAPRLHGAVYRVYSMRQHQASRAA